MGTPPLGGPPPAGGLPTSVPGGYPPVGSKALIDPSGKGYRSRMQTPEQRAADAYRGPNYQSPIASDPTSTSWRVAHGLSPFLNGTGMIPSTADLAAADIGGKGLLGGGKRPKLNRG